MADDGLFFDMNMGGNANKNAEDLYQKLLRIQKKAVELQNIFKEDKGQFAIKDPLNSFANNIEKTRQQLALLEGKIKSLRDFSELADFLGMKKQSKSISDLISRLQILKSNLEKPLKAKDSAFFATDKITHEISQFKTIDEVAKLIIADIKKAEQAQAAKNSKSKEEAMNLQKTLTLMSSIKQQMQSINAAKINAKDFGLNQYLPKFGSIIAQLNKLSAALNANKSAMSNEMLRQYTAQFNKIKASAQEVRMEIDKMMGSEAMRKSLENMAKSAATQFNAIRGLIGQGMAKGLSGQTLGNAQGVSASLQILINDINKLKNSSELSEASVLKISQRLSELSGMSNKAKASIRQFISEHDKFNTAKAKLAEIEGKFTDLSRAIQRVSSKGLNVQGLDRIRQIRGELNSLMLTLSQNIANKNFTGIQQVLDAYKVLSKEANTAAKQIRLAEQAQAAMNKKLMDQRAVNAKQGSVAPWGYYQATMAPYDNIINKMNQIGKATSFARDMFNQFKAQMALTFMNVYGIEALLKKIITIGGEFERQHRALQTILGDIQQADALFGQLKNLAANSPFTFKDLATYSKQLAAFSIPYSELYDTTNRLSNLSAGLGVSMDRLILAYGQVRSATVLRGQELRQFTEAGVPMVQKLADYFTKLNGKIVETKDIFKMISDKQVPFEAVANVIKEMTDKGGEFYNMQEVISDTLSGRFTNMRDAWEILLSRFADGDGAIGSMMKKIIELTTYIMRHSDILFAAITGYAGTRMIKNAAMGVGAMGMVKNTDLGTGYLQAKRSEIAEARKRLNNDALMLSLNKKLTKERIAQSKIDRQLVESGVKMTNKDWRMLATAGYLNKYQIASLATSKKITAELAKQLLLNQGLKTKEAERLLQSNGFTRFGMQMKGFASSFVSGIQSFFSGFNLAFMGIGAAITAISMWYQDSEEKLRRASQVVKEAKTQYEDLNRFINANEVPITDSQELAKKAYDKFKEELEKVDPNYKNFIINVDIEEGDDFVEKAKRLKLRLEEILDIKLQISKMSDTEIEKIAESSNGFFDEPMTTNAKDYYKKQENFLLGLDEISEYKFNEIINGLSHFNEQSKKVAEKAKEIRKSTGSIKAALEYLSYSDETVKYYNNLKGSDTGYIPEFFKNLSSRNQYLEDLFGDADETIEYLKEHYKDKFKDGELTEVGKAWAMDLFSKIADGAELDSGAKETYINAMMMRMGVFDEGFVSRFVTDWVKKNYGELYSNYVRNPGKYQNGISAAFEQGFDFFKEEYRSYHKNLQSWCDKNKMNIRLGYQITIKPKEVDVFKQELTKTFGETVLVKAKVDFEADIVSALESINKYQKELRTKFKPMQLIIASFGIKMDFAKTFEEQLKYLENYLKGNNVNPFAKFLLSSYRGMLQDVVSATKGLEHYGIKPDVPEVKNSKGSRSSGGGKKEDKSLKEAKDRLSKYKDLLSQIENYRKRYGENAFKAVQKTGLFDEIIKFIGEGNVQEVEQSVKKIIKALGSLSTEERKSFAEDAKKYISNEIYNKELKGVQKVNEEYRVQIDLLREQYDVYKKLYTLTGDKILSATLAGNNYFSNGDMVSYMKEKAEKAIRDYNKNTGANISFAEIIGKSENEIKEKFGQESEAYQPIIDYLNEEKKVRKEILDMMINGLSMEFELEDKLSKIRNKATSERETLQNALSTEKDPTKKANIQKAIDNINRKEQEDTAKVNLDIAKRDIGWDVIFGNLGNASNATLTKVINLVKEQIKVSGQTPETIKTLVDQLEKIKEEIKKRNPYETLINAFKGDKVDREGLQQLLRADSRKKITFGSQNDFGMKAGTYTREELQEIAYGNNMDDFNKSLSAVSKDFKNLSDILAPLISMLDNLGVDMGTFKDILQMPSNALSAAASTGSAFSGLSNTFSNAKSAGLQKIGGFLGKAGPWASIASFGMSFLGSIFALHDKALQKEIEASQQRQKEMENFSKNLETSLKRAFGGLYNTTASANILAKLDKYLGGNSDRSLLGKLMYKDYVGEDTKGAIEEAKQSKSYYDAQYATLLAQRDEINHQMELEDKKKKTDKGKMEDYRQQLEELDDAIKYFAQDMAKELYDIDIKGWAKTLSDSLVDAWANGTDAMLAYKNSLKDLISTVTKNIITQRIMEKMLEPVDNIVAEEMEKRDGQLNEDSIVRIYEGILKYGGNAKEYIFALLDKLKAEGFDLSETSSNSTIGKGIQSVTEDTADLLASYINAIRADVSINRSALQKIAEGLLPSLQTSMNVQLTELKNINSNTARGADAAEQIKELLSSVITVGNGGKKIRV